MAWPSPQGPTCPGLRPGETNVDQSVWSLRRLGPGWPHALDEVIRHRTGVTSRRASLRVSSAAKSRSLVDVSAAPDAQFRADQVLTALLALIVFGNFVTQPLGLTAEWLDGRQLVAALVGPLVGAWYGAWLLREARSSTDQSGTPTRRRRPSADLVFIVAMAAAGLATEAVVLPPLVAASMSNTGFGALAAAAYAAAFRLPRRTSILILLAVSVGHAVALRTMPTESLQGAAELAVIWAGTRLVVAEVRRAAQDAQEAAEAAGRAEREEASARVHDALGLLRVVARGDAGGTGLQRAAQETARRTEVWLQDSAGGPTLAQAVGTVIGQFPDLDVVLDLTRLSVPADPAVVTAVGRAVHTLLGNVREHAGAARVDIMAADAPGGWILTIHDDGRGFDVAATTAGGGLSRYTHAALDAVGVAMTLVSAPGAGTTVTLRASVSGLPEDRPGSRRVGRFAAWRLRPTGGLARAAWISDVIQAALVASYAVMVLTGFPHLLRHSQRPVIAGALVVAAIAT